MTVWSGNEKIKISTKHLDKVCQMSGVRVGVYEYVILICLFIPEK